MEIDNALNLLMELCEQHGAKCYLEAYDKISAILAETLNIQKCPNCGSTKPRISLGEIMFEKTIIKALSEEQD